MKAKHIFTSFTWLFGAFPFVLFSRGNKCSGPDSHAYYCLCIQEVSDYFFFKTSLVSGQTLSHVHNCMGISLLSKYDKYLCVQERCL